MKDLKAWANRTMLARNRLKFIIRVVIFLAFFVYYCFFRNEILLFLEQDFFGSLRTGGLHVLHLLWFLFVFMMLRHLFPPSTFSMSLRKSERDTCREAEGYDREKLRAYVREENRKAVVLMIYWVVFNLVFFILYLTGVLDKADLLMISVFYFLGDYVCILLFCPYQTYIMHSGCCVNCRAYDWGHLFMFTPMLFYFSFYSFSLFLLGLAVFIRWEVLFLKHPERFWAGSNLALRCNECGEKTCRHKKALAAHFPLKIRFIPEKAKMGLLLGLLVIFWVVVSAILKKLNL